MNTERLYSVVDNTTGRGTSGLVAVDMMQPEAVLFGEVGISIMESRQSSAVMLPVYSRSCMTRSCCGIVKGMCHSENDVTDWGVLAILVY